MNRLSSLETFADNQRIEEKPYTKTKHKLFKVLFVSKVTIFRRDEYSTKLQKYRKQRNGEQF